MHLDPCLMQLYKLIGFKGIFKGPRKIHETKEVSWMKRLQELILYGLHHTIDHTNERRMNNCTDMTHVAQRNFSKTNNYKSNEPNL